MKYLHALNTIPGIGSKTLKKLLKHFRSSENIWKASSTDMLNCGISEKIAQKVTEAQKDLNPDKLWEDLTKENIQVISILDKKYPKNLKEIPSPPFLLYVKGNLEMLNTPMLAIVGSRKFTQYGKQVAYSFAKELAAMGITVVSGMALGIDAIAHQGALDTKGNTIGILGNSLDDASIAPRTNFNLSQKITNSGALISEYPPITKASPNTFPARNRIMAGLTDGTIVVEAAQKSGTLITANLALDFNREVFAVPGPIHSPQSEGTHYLIKNGAKITTSVSDILEELNFTLKQSQNQPKENKNLTDTQKIIYNNLLNEPVQIEKLARITSLNMAQLNQDLMLMEVQGIIKNIGSQSYIKI